MAPTTGQDGCWTGPHRLDDLNDLWQHYWACSGRNGYRRGAQATLVVLQAPWLVMVTVMI